MTFDILYSLKGDKYIARHLRTVASQGEALEIAGVLSNFPAGVIHFAITCDDGRTIHDSSKQGLLV